MKPIRTLSLLLVLSGLALGAQTPAAAPAQGTGSGPGARATQPRTAAAANVAGGMTLKEVRDAFTKADADRSGSLSVDEAAFGGLDGAGFTAGDADGDGRLSQDEYVVASESRVARLSGGAASDLTAESTRLQTLRRARQAEALKTRREAAAGSATSGASGSPGAAAPQAGATGGPAAARRALAAEQAAPAAPVPGAKATGEKPADLQEIRASIVRRLRNGEITEADAQTAIEAIDRRIALATGAAEASKPRCSGGNGTGGSGPGRRGGQESGPARDRGLAQPADPQQRHPDRAGRRRLRGHPAPHRERPRRHSAAATAPRQAPAANGSAPTALPAPSGVQGAPGPQAPEEPQDSGPRSPKPSRT
jgi:hypothetical protein